MKLVMLKENKTSTVYTIKALANSVDPDERPQNVVSHLGLHCMPLIHIFVFSQKEEIFTLQPLYNMIHYNTVLDITRFKDGSQKCLGYIEIYTFLFGYNRVV